MEQYRSHELWLAEQQQINDLKISHPELMDWVGQFRHQDILRHIGITTIPDNLPVGYIRFRPEDFIVEEINRDGQLSTIEVQSNPLVDSADHRTLFAQLVKIGIATPEALERVSRALNIDRRFIGFAGLKDAGAITSQNISLRGVDASIVEQLAVDNVILKNLRYGSGTVSNGDLRGNRFTLTIRTQQPLQQGDLDEHCEKLSAGVVNFYGTQRFGNRWLSHYFGRLLVRGQFEEAVWKFLTDVNSGERKYTALIRQTLREKGKDWEYADHEFSQFPYTFQHELTVIRHLRQHPDDWIGALTTIQEQVRLWVYAYMSYLLNQTMSDIVTSGQPLPPVLPIPLSQRAEDLQPYLSLLEQDEVPLHFTNTLRALPFIRPQPRQLETMIHPTFHGHRVHDVGCIVSFDLPSGAYATTVLMNLFTLESGQPAPAWIKADGLDPKAVLGAGSIQVLQQRYEKYFTKKDVAIEE